MGITYVGKKALSFVGGGRESYAKAAIKAGAKLIFDPDKATGTSIGINAPLTNPIVDLSKNSNNGILTNFNGTTASGYVQKLLANGRTKTFVKGDGTDDYIRLVDNGSVDIVGTNDFAIGFVMLTPETLSGSGYIIVKSSDSTNSNIQFAVYYVAGILYLRLAGTSITTTLSIQNNTLYDIRVIRKSGVLTVTANGNVVYSASNTLNLVSKPNIRLFAISAVIDGTAHGSYANVYLGKLLIYYNGASGLVEADVIKSFNNLTKDYF